MEWLHFAEPKVLAALTQILARRAAISAERPCPSLCISFTCPQLCLHFITFCAELETGLVASHEADVACEPGNQQVAPFLVFYI